MTLVTIGGLVAAVLGSAGLRQLRLASPAFQPAAAFPVCGPGAGQDTARIYKPLVRSGHTRVTLVTTTQQYSVTVCRGHGVGWAGLLSRVAARAGNEPSRNKVSQTQRRPLLELIGQVG